MKLVVTNYDFFRAVEAGVTQVMKMAETGLYKAAEEACQKMGLEIDINRPVEGHYRGDKWLKRYFLARETLTDPKNYSEETAAKARTIEEIAALHDFLQNPVFGPQQLCRDAFNEDNVYDPDMPGRIISPRIDAVRMATQKLDPFHLTIPDIFNIVGGMRDHGEGLLAYAILVDSRAEPGNPVASTLALATDAVYIPKSRGITQQIGMTQELEWHVDKDVLKIGNLVLELYNAMFAKHAELIGEKLKMMPPLEERDVKMVRIILTESGKSPLRCVHIQTVDSMDPIRYFHLATCGTENNLTAYEFMDTRIVPTEEIPALSGAEYKPKV